MLKVADLPFLRSIPSTTRRNNQKPVFESLEPRQFLDSVPTVTLLAPPEVQGNSYLLHVRYSDDTGINTASINESDVRLVGDNGSEIFSNGVITSQPANGSVDVTYIFGRPSTSGFYNFNLQPLEVSDEAGNTVAPETLARIEVSPSENQPPVATLTSAPQRVGDQYFFEVTFKDNVAIDNDSIIQRDPVRIVGPRGFNKSAELQSIVTTPDGSKIVRYAVPISAQPGRYTIVIAPNGVSDTSGNTVAPGPLATFILKPAKAP